jgi:hypothetical protein
MQFLTQSPRRLIGVAGLGLTLLLAPATAFAATASPQQSAPTASAPHLIGSNESSSVRPTRYNPISNDGAGTVIGLHWSSWAGSAKGSGKFYAHVAGKARLYAVNVSAWRVRSGDYTRFRYSFPHSVPSGLSRSWVISYYAHRWHGKVV